ncbi:MAG: tRNA (adenosine(37)-N6)-threonylcarbamoyltransferase complex dimerization subunit type 1 TsaB, partial [Candidatus Omnitrophica bacterium]|nr:tRNA (adenosine(37)-N6)-threonylcarbamoyltransferase complex dimerization subunit type 1 TsaB [Candidatus Omnitrophota bacterium]
MRLLSLDTSTKRVCLCLSDNARVCEYTLETGTRLSSLLLPIIQQTTGAWGWKLEDIDYFACGIGPGSFTGLRIGIAAIKGMAWSLQKPVVGIPTLDILARNAERFEGIIVPLIDAKRSLVYTALYRNSRGRFTRISPYMLLTPDTLVDAIARKAVRKQEVIAFGDGLAVCREQIIAGIKRAVLLDKDYWQIAALRIARLAEGMIREKKTTDASRILPLYLYPKECQV